MSVHSAHFGIGINPKYPLPAPVSLMQRKVIEAAIKEAWQQTKGNHGNALSSRSETDLTAELVERLNVMLVTKPSPIKGFSCRFFETINRGNELYNYDRTQKEKRPDITIRTAGDPPKGVLQKDYWGLFIESKLIGSGTQVKLYGSDGISRFVDGRYAWAVTESMMLGYASKGYTVPKHLIPHLQINRSTLKCPRAPQRLSTAGVVPEIWESTHNRRWCHTTGDQPQSISIGHMWLEV